MYNAIRLFVDGLELEFSTAPQILYNYKVTDFQNPTTYINGYSKNIQVEGTPRNNDIFGHIWRLDRQQSYEGNLGPSFNPYKRAGFELFVNGELYEKGYCKLNNVNKNGNKIVYEISLFCGVGNFFYSLTYLNNDSDRKKTLYDILPLEDFTINKELVDGAWSDLASNTHNQWETLNFAVTSEGLPDDFDSEKILVNLWGTNMSGTSGEYSAILNGSPNEYGYALGEMPFELTADNAFDLRSYLLRPVLRVQKVIDACCNPELNGGYQIDLDSHFFTGDNPYYWDAWMTLPTLKELEIEKKDTGTTTGSITNTSHNYKTLSIGPNPLDVSPTSIEMNVRLRFTPNGSSSSSILYTNTKLKADSFGSDTSKVFWMENNSAVMVQLIAYDENDNQVGHSDAYMLSSYPYQANTQGKKLWAYYDFPDGTTNIREIEGHFKKSGSYYYFYNNDNEEVGITFKLNKVKYDHLKFYVQTPMSNCIIYSVGPTGRYSFDSSGDTAPLSLYTTQLTETSNHYSKQEALALNRVQGDVMLELVGNSVILANKANATLFSNTLIPAEKLLSTDFTPCDFLLSYCKMFGLYFYQNPQEEALDPETCPNGVIHICDRDTFYTDDIENLHQMIDRGKEMKINPAVAKSKWYEFKLEGIGSEAEENFKNSYGYDYGRQLIDTSYDFDKKTIELYDGNVFRNGVMVQEKNKFFNAGSDGYPAYFYGGLDYNLFKAGTDGYDATTIQFPRKALSSVPINNDGLEYYDSMPKLQVHSEDISNNDGAYVLLFYDGFRGTNDAKGQAVIYNLTDDLEDMATLNDGNPCWFWSKYQFNANGQTVSIRRNQLPVFTRDIVRGGNIIHSWNFGHPKETFVPDTYTTEGDSIYDKCWKNYIGDLYNVNDRQLSCYVRLLGRPNPDLMRKFFWFDNAIWRLNEVKDWNLNANTTTLCEFIKVQDTANYSLQRITKVGRTVLTLNSYEIDYTGGTITGKMRCQNSSERWAFEDAYYYSYTDGTDGWNSTYGFVSPLTGMGLETNVTFTIPQNNTPYEKTYRVGYEGSDDQVIYVYITQAGKPVSEIYFSPSAYRRNADAGTMMLTFVQQNMVDASLTVSKDVSWLGTPSISGNSRVLITNSANTTTTARTGYVTITGYGTDGQQHSAQAAITQSGQEYEPGWIEFTNTALTVTYYSGTTDESFRIGGSLEMSDLRVYGGDGWATPRIQSATSEVFIDYTENGGASARTTYIKIYGYDDLGMRRSATLQLTQNAQPQQTLFVDPAQLDMTYARVYGMNLTITGTSGDYNITITDN